MKEPVRRYKDVWGQWYKTVTKNLGALKTTSPTDVVTMKKIKRALFPTYPERGGTNFGNVEDFPIFKCKKLELAVRTMKARNAPVSYTHLDVYKRQ